MLNMFTTDIQQPGRQTLETIRGHLRMSKAELCRCLAIRPTTYNEYLRGKEVPPLVLNGLDQLLRDRQAGQLPKG